MERLSTNRSQLQKSKTFLLCLIFKITFWCFRFETVPVPDEEKKVQKTYIEHLNSKKSLIHTTSKKHKIYIFKIYRILNIIIDDCWSIIILHSGCGWCDYAGERFLQQGRGGKSQIKTLALTILINHDDDQPFNYKSWYIFNHSIFHI